jgi:hypothetical protein
LSFPNYVYLKIGFSRKRIVTTADKVKMLYAEKTTTETEAKSLAISTSFSCVSNSTGNSINTYFGNMGHALKKRKPLNHLNQKQKQFIYNAYMKGEETRRKISAENLSQMFRTTLDCHGNQLFHPTEYLAKQQVLSQFSRLASNRKNNQVSNYLKSSKNSFDADEEAYDRAYDLNEATDEDKFVETHNALVNVYILNGIRANLVCF